MQKLAPRPRAATPSTMATGLLRLARNAVLRHALAPMQGARGGREARGWGRWPGLINKRTKRKGFHRRKCHISLPWRALPPPLAAAAHGRGGVLNLSFPVWSRDVDTVVRHQWYITARCTRTLARLRHATLFNPHMHGAAINTHSYCVVRTARLGSNYALAAQSGSAALLSRAVGELVAVCYRLTGYANQSSRSDAELEGPI